MRNVFNFGKIYEIVDEHIRCICVKCDGRLQLCGSCRSRVVVGGGVQIGGTALYVLVGGG